MRTCTAGRSALRPAALLCLVVLAAAPAGAQPSGVLPPVPGPVVRAFDPPLHPYGPGHRGVDLLASADEAIRAPLGGRVHFAGRVAGVGWVSLDHGGTLRTTYGPLTPEVQAGASVRAGQVIGLLEPDATHLDWGALVANTYIDPLVLLVRWRLHLVAS